VWEILAEGFLKEVEEAMREGMGSLRLRLDGLSDEETSLLGWRASSAEETPMNRYYCPPSDWYH
jgi:hypothetical protein